MGGSLLGGNDGSGPVLSRRAIARGAAGASTLAALGLSARSNLVSAQEGQTVAVSESGGISMEFAGAIHQNSFDFTVFGIFTFISGLDDSVLFTNDDPATRTPDVARFTFHGTAKGTSRTVHETLFHVNATGQFGVRFNDKGGATFDDPNSFAAGEQVATFSISIQNIVNVIAPKSGLCTGFGDLTVVRTSTFQPGKTSYVIGRQGASATIDYTGQGTLLDPNTPVAQLTIGGNFRF